MEKPCRKCGVIKSLSEFHKHKQMGDGHLHTCKECNKAYMREAHAKKMLDSGWVILERARCRIKERQAIASGRRKKLTPEQKQKAMTNYKLKFPEKERAHDRVAKALASGKLNRHPCAVCGAKAQAHHADYSKPLDVMWLCPKHHAEQHVKEREALILAKMT